MSERGPLRPKMRARGRLPHVVRMRLPVDWDDWLGAHVAGLPEPAAPHAGSRAPVSGGALCCDCNTRRHRPLPEAEHLDAAIAHVGHCE